ncbi:MAG: polyprenyl synthetase family protein [Acidobacteriota bacterium]|jgi:geranylgeranyl diphosphate synthase type II|nr:polyprenyl synthetase family protein [Acidobacteriota bacterium]MDQ3372384.1 polyprenyl synthetase family protein [Acidobacteriota bacterium]
MSEEKNIIVDTNLWQYVEKHKPGIEKGLRRFLPLAPPQIETKFNEAVEYALFSGGKRLRPVLTLLGAELVGGKPENIIPAAAAVEFIHTSSLIFDDLPCMDDASERRGKTSLHARFDEGLSVLVAIGFLNASYGLVFVNHQGTPEFAMRAHAEIVSCVGAAGMLGGQSVDLVLAKGAGANNFLPKNNHSKSANYNFESIRNLKTSALMRLALRVGAILEGASHLELTHLLRFAELLGDAYQLSDDLIDMAEDREIFASDETKKTFAINQGQEGARLKLKAITGEAKRVLIDNFPANQARFCLTQMTDYLAERKV